MFLKFEVRVYPMYLDVRVYPKRFRVRNILDVAEFLDIPPAIEEAPPTSRRRSRWLPQNMSRRNPLHRGLLYSLGSGSKVNPDPAPPLPGLAPK